eukprot:TRINITY_DN10985_c0_g2_i1.p1 TRINITY_DN10985_c0_g2~~TRINITY_DN10985_c0_g2_i1.p1  ORF type:complete len:729 (+),score=195.33 TRINITY_DN10985_c0_g2_i1:94-2280(+)
MTSDADRLEIRAMALGLRESEERTLIHLERRQWQSDMQQCSLQGHLEACAASGWRRSSGVGPCPALIRSMTPRNFSSSSRPEELSGEDAVRRIFDYFDTDGDGHWSYSEAAEWMHHTQGHELTDADWDSVCGDLGADTQPGLTLAQVRTVYSEHDPLEHLRLIWDGGDAPGRRDADNANQVWSAMDDEEDAADYCEGGYHRVAPGDRLDGRYVVHSKLGWGQFSTVWLARDEEGGPPVALKISKAAEDFRLTSAHEIDVLQQMNVARDEPDADGDNELQALRTYGDQCVRLHRVFDIVGPHGTHCTVAMEAVGPNLLKIATGHEFNGISPAIVKALTRQVLEGLAFTHDVMKLAHCDLKPENILLATIDEDARKAIAAGQPICQARTERLLKGVYDPPQPGESLADCVARQYRCKVSDFGSTRWVQRDNPPQRLQTLEYRAPDIVLGYPPDTGIDVFSCACMVFELLTGNFLFNPKNQTEIDQDIYHLILFQQLLGSFPEHIALGPGVRCPDFFDDQGLFLYQTLEEARLEDILVHTYGMEPPDAEELASFLRPMLDLDPDKRATARSALRHSWLTIRPEDAKLSPQAEAAGWKPEFGTAAAPPAGDMGSSSGGVSGEDIASPPRKSSGAAAMHFDPGDPVPPPPPPEPVSVATYRPDSSPRGPRRPMLEVNTEDPPAVHRMILMEVSGRASTVSAEVASRARLRGQFFDKHLEAIKNAAYEQSAQAA